MEKTSLFKKEYEKIYQKKSGCGNWEENYQTVQFEIMKNQFPEINKVLYPGSFIHINPSFVFPQVVYVDSFKKAAKIFQDHRQEIQNLIDSKKNYTEPAQFQFFSQDYNQKLPINICSTDRKAQSGVEPEFDLIISQYAGFVSESSKKYLKPNGILLANDSHGDASLANFDPDFQLIGVIEEENDQNGKYTLQYNDKNLDDYFVQLKGKKKKVMSFSVEQIKKDQKGPKYDLNPISYVFQKKVIKLSKKIKK